MKVPIAITMACVMMFTSVVGAAAGAVPPEERIKRVKHSVAGIPAGAVVEIQLLSKEKFQGRLGAVTDAGFLVQVAKREKIEDRSLRFEEVKSIKHLSKEHPAVRVVTWAVVGGLVAVGVIVLVFVLRYVNGGWG